MDSSLRILQVLRSPMGGLFRHVVDLARGLAARGHQIGLVFDETRLDRRTEERLNSLANEFVLGLHAWPLPRFFGWGDIRALHRLRGLSRRVDAQILHGHGAKGGMHARVTCIGSRNRVAFYTPHGGALHYRPDSAAGRLVAGLERVLMAQTDAIIFESRFAERTYSTQIATPTCRSAVVYNGLAADEFQPLTLAEVIYDFCFVGELRELKGVHFLIEALTVVRPPDGRPAQLIIAGDGPDRDALVRKIEDMGLHDRVTLVGIQPARSIFAQARCVVVPSLAESLPYVVLEAAAAGKPVIATRVGGIPEIFGPTASALVAPGDAYALGKAMQAFLDDPCKANSELAERLAHVKQGFSQELMIDAVERVYIVENNLIEAGSGRTLAEQQLNDVNSQLIQVRAQVAEAKARLHRILAVNDNDIVNPAVTDALENPVIMKVREQYLSAVRREADFSARYGTHHPAAAELRNEIAQLRSAARDELNRIAEAYRSEYVIAQSREQAVEANLNEAIGLASFGKRAGVSLRLLESSAQSYRRIYDSFLQRFTDSIQQQSFPRVEARVITPARLGEKSHPNIPLVLGGAVMVGLLGGVALAFAREQVALGPNKAHHVEDLAGLKLIRDRPVGAGGA